MSLMILDLSIKKITLKSGLGMGFIPYFGRIIGKFQHE